VRRRSLGLVAAGALLLAAPGSVGAATAGHRTVTLKDIAFHKPTVTIKRGQSVRWVWRDGQYTPHNVVFRQLHKHSATKTSGSYTLRFDRKGTYRYMCTIHLNMTGKVVVR
jgi:plastocyanin